MHITSSVALVLVWLAAGTSSFAQDAPFAAPPPVLSDQQLLRKYVWSTLGLPGVLHATLASGLEQWQTDPPEWGTGSAGYAKRWASSFAESAIGSTTKYAVARLLHQDPSFTRCECSGVAPRLRHALVSPFTARTRGGHRILSPAIVAGLVTENVVSASTWYPAELGTRDGFRHAAFGVLSKMGVDVFREFVHRDWKMP
jgi:hypothetical protein